MPAVTVPDMTALPRISVANPDSAAERPVVSVTTAPAGFEGEGFPVRRAFAGMSLQALDPFVHMDQMGEVNYAPGEPKGTPWHPHRGFETVTYMIDGTFAHQDSQGGGGLITDGATQWMTAGGGILHIETPPEDLVVSGGLFHGIQLWVNLPAKDKLIPPAYQGIEAGQVAVLSSADAGSLVRVIAGQLGDYHGPGSTHTPMTLMHATVAPGALLELPWDPGFNALVYVLAGSGQAGSAGTTGAGRPAGRVRPRRLDRDPGRGSSGFPRGESRDSPARGAAHRRASRALRAIRDEHAGRSDAGAGGFPGWSFRQHPAGCANAVRT